MTTVKNMAYWRAKNKCKSEGNYDGGKPDLKANRSPMKMDPTMVMAIANKLGDAKNKEDKSDTDISPMPQTVSGKGNIFTKRGRKQRAINKYVKARKNIGDEGGGVTSDKSKKKIDKAYKRLMKAQRNTEHDLTQYAYDKEAGRKNAYQKQEEA